MLHVHLLHADKLASIVSYTKTEYYYIIPLQRDNSDINQIYLGIETICNSDENCTAALVELNGNTDCVNAIVNDNNAVQCSASCRTLVTTALDTCPDVGNKKSINQ